MNTATRASIAEQSFGRELTRKAIHLTIALVPAMADWNFVATVILLSAGIIFYVVNEAARMAGRSGGVVSRLTAIAARPMERGFVWGPITLGLGTLAALLYYPDPAATVAIYALAFGDSIASLAGKFLVRRHVVMIGEKTLVGSAFCFLTVFVSSHTVLNRIGPSLVSAAVATVLELFSAQDADNLFIPIGTGFVLTLMT